MRGKFRNKERKLLQSGIKIELNFLYFIRILDVIVGTGWGKVG